jgi:4-methyl-5(b-hydroxyethyl)-thiazole monophosphate biosynthesis
MPRERKKQIFILVASGFEETDVSTVTRTLRRSGLPVALVGLTAGSVRGNYGLSLEPDLLLSEISTEPPLAVVLPGGLQGARQLNADPRVHALLHEVLSRQGYIMALDAAYMVLRSSGVLDKVEAWPAQTPVSDWSEERNLSGRVIVEGPVIFGRDSGAVQEAALTLVSLIESRKRTALR